MATKSAASEEILGMLHAKVAKVMASALEQIEQSQRVYDDLLADATQDVVDEILSKRPELSPALISAVTKFLADNKITCNPAEDENVSDLERRLASKKKRRAIGNVVPFEADD